MATRVKRSTGRGRPRTARPKVDRGTPELRAKRQAMVGGADPVLAEHPLGILYARDILDADQYRAGLRYAFLFGKVYGRTTAATGEMERLSGGDAGPDLSDRDAERYEADLRRARTCLLAVGRAAKDAVDNAAVYERLPAWLFRGRPAPGARRPLVEGLRALDALFTRPRKI